MEEFLLTNHISTGIRFIDIMFLSNFGIMCCVGQLIPYAFFSQGKKVYKTFGFIFAFIAATCSSYIFVAHESKMPIYSGTCDTYMYSNDFMILYSSFVVSRMLIDAFQYVFFEDLSKLNTKLLLFHHLIIFIGGSFGLHYDTMQHYFTSYAMAEVSTVFLNFKDFYKEVLGINNKGLDTINLGLFFVTFFIFRIVWMPYRHISDLITYQMCGNNQFLPLFLNGLSFPITCLSYYWWFVQIVPLAKKKLT